MIPWTDLALIPVSIGSLLAVMALVRFLAPRFGFSTELQRKIVHVSTGLYALTLPYTFSTRQGVLVLLALSLGVLGILRLPAFSSGSLGAAVHSVKRKSYGEIYLTLAVGFIIWFSSQNLALYVLPILVLTLSDTAAALAGTRYGSRHFNLETGMKSWEGVAMFFLVTWLLSLIVLLLMTNIDRADVVVLSLLIAAFGALVEADSWGGLDNLFVPVGIHLLLATHYDTPTSALVLIAILFIAGLIFAVPLGAIIGLKPHSARAYLVLFFLIFAVTAPHNAILPMLAVLAHIAARTRAPCRSPFPDLDLIAVTAGAGLGWLFIGEMVGQTAINLYGLTFAGMAAGFLALALGGLKKPIAIGSAVAGAGAVFAIFLAIAERANCGLFCQPLWPWALAGIALPTMAAVAAPHVFQRYRSLRMLAAAAIAPLVILLKGFLP